MATWVLHFYGAKWWNSTAIHVQLHSQHQRLFIRWWADDCCWFINNKFLLFITFHFDFSCRCPSVALCFWSAFWCRIDMIWFCPKTEANLHRFLKPRWDRILIAQWWSRYLTNNLLRATWFTCSCSWLTVKNMLLQNIWLFHLQQPGRLLTDLYNIISLNNAQIY